MTWPWIVAFVTLSVVVIFTLFLQVGTTKRISALIGQGQDDDASVRRGPASGLKPGEQLGEFRAPSSTGVLVDSTSLLGKARIYLFLGRNCSPCDVLAAELNDGEDSPRLPHGLELVVIVRSMEEASDLGLAHPLLVLIDREGHVFSTFRNSATPRAFLVSASGLVIDKDVPNHRRDVNDLARTSVSSAGLEVNN